MAQLELLECFRNDPQLREKVERLNGAEERLEVGGRAWHCRPCMQSLNQGSERN